MTENKTLNAKKRNRKIYITDIAINKIPKIKFRGLSVVQNQAINTLTKEVLKISQMENDSNEVALTCTLASDDPMDVVGISLGSEHFVDVCADTISNHLLVSSKECAVVVMHNHPSTQTLSIEDIRFFLSYTSVKFMIVVTNQGNVHYLCKEDAYSYDNARILYNTSIEGLTKNSPTKDVYLAGLSFLARCSEVGLFYS